MTRVPDAGSMHVVAIGHDLVQGEVSLATRLGRQRPRETRALALVVESCMPRYFFDIHDGQNLVRDNVGTECGGQDAIRAEAMTALPAIARDIIPKDGDRQALTVIVRNASNLTVFTATLTFASIWLGEDVPPVTDDSDQAEHVPLLWGR